MWNPMYFTFWLPSEPPVIRAAFDSSLLIKTRVLRLLLTVKTFPVCHLHILLEFLGNPWRNGRTGSTTTAEQVLAESPPWDEGWHGYWRTLSWESAGVGCLEGWHAPTLCGIFSQLVLLAGMETSLSPTNFSGWSGVCGREWKRPPLGHLDSGEDHYRNPRPWSANCNHPRWSQRPHPKWPSPKAAVGTVCVVIPALGRDGLPNPGELGAEVNLMLSH